MCYYQNNGIVNVLHARSRVVSALVAYIKHRMEELKKTPSEVADDGGLNRQAVSYILNKEKKNGKPVRPEPDTIRGLAKGLDVEAPLLTALMGYPTEPQQGIDPRYYEIAQRLTGAPWIADRMGDLLSLPQRDFEELMDRLDYHLDRQQKRDQGKGRDRRRRNGSRSSP